MKTQIFIQARMGSTRLPKKVLLKVLGKTIIELMLERLRNVNDIDKIVLVTTQNKEDEALVKEAKRLGIDSFQGSQENILDRFYQAARVFKPDNIIRVSADCPLIDFTLINKGLDIFSQGDYDIVSNGRMRTFPDGMDFEIFRVGALETAWQENPKDQNEFLGPTTYLLEKKKFKNGVLMGDINLSHIRLTLDNKEDFDLVKIIYENLYPKNKGFTLKDILEFLKSRPDLLNLNYKFIKLDYGLKLE
ncbi:MAG: glycosyltransferase family protein [Candidatus Nealsonbacteria bacterium]|nr:glycosyltransferase family protein [Candidatus Nealsonbacteria bacterium]